MYTSPMQPFVGRENELRRLQDLSRSGRASLVVIKGRRRIGKSRLAEEFGKGKELLHKRRIYLVPAQIPGL